ncbi:DNA polymerase III delta prime subunit [Thermodesulfovibrio sp. N1]|uniref:DNA polymerase III subunit n=1 Tax=Thermodesulfovibrio sp. N1 TaxID=1871110 RepID=UPI00083A9341|nr:DNA polymerase III subunit [Thermodesulfovibrio sp. N1]ODA44276.1 DNA polymerase III delta prime subunit [Thermodesulfovibrio sp. N1]
MSFKKIVSQERAIRVLQGTIKKERIPSAFLFIGEPYIGKTTTAIEYAKALNCLDNDNFDSCDFCKSCKKIEKGIHPDLKVVTAEKDTITIDNIRDLEEFVSLQSLEGKYKVVIVKNADKMNQYAANAMLKTLEEPPPNTVLILTCENIDALPEPLVSRTFKVFFNPLSKEAISRLIDEKQILCNSDILPSCHSERSEESLPFNIIGMSSFGLHLRTTPQSIESLEITLSKGEGEESLKEELIKFSMGRPGLFISMDILRKIKDFKETLNFNKIKKSPWKHNEDLKWWLDFVFIMLRDRICQKLFGDKITTYFSFEKSFYREEITLEELFICYDQLQNIRKNVDLNLNKSILWNYINQIMRRVLNE